MATEKFGPSWAVAGFSLYLVRLYSHRYFPENYPEGIQPFSSPGLKPGGRESAPHTNPEGVEPRFSTFSVLSANYLTYTAMTCWVTLLYSSTFPAAALFPCGSAVLRNGR